MSILNQFKNLISFNSERKNILKKSLTYIISDIINKIIPFLLLPIITRYLQPSDYGVLSVFDSIVGFLAVFVGLGSQEMVKVNYFIIKKEELSVYIGTVFQLTLITSAVYVAFFFLFRHVFMDKYGLDFIWLFFAVILTFAAFFSKIISTIWISEGKSLSFAKYQNSYSIITVLTTILFVVILKLNWQGRVYSLLISAFIFAIAAFYFIRKKNLLRITLSWKNLWECIKESTGVLPYSLSFWFKNAALLLIIALLIGNKETGLYSSAFRIAIIVNFVAISLNKVWQPYFFKLLSAANTQSGVKIVKSVYLYMGLIIIAGIFLIIFSKFIVTIALAPSYHSAVTYVRYLVIAITLQSLFTALGDFLMFHKANKKLTFASVTGIIIQYILIFLFYSVGEVTVMNIIFSLIMAGVITLILSWIMVYRVRTLPWFFFLSNINSNLKSGK